MALHRAAMKTVYTLLSLPIVGLLDNRSPRNGLSIGDGLASMYSLPETGVRAMLSSRLCWSETYAMILGIETLSWIDYCIRKQHSEP